MTGSSVSNVGTNATWFPENRKRSKRLGDCFHEIKLLGSELALPIYVKENAAQRMRVAKEAASQVGNGLGVTGCKVEFIECTIINRSDLE